MIAEIFWFIICSIALGFVIHILDEGFMGWLKGREARRAERKRVG